MYLQAAVLILSSRDRSRQRERLKAPHLVGDSTYDVVPMIPSVECFAQYCGNLSHTSYTEDFDIVKVDIRFQSTGFWSRDMCLSQVVDDLREYSK